MVVALGLGVELTKTKYMLHAIRTKTRGLVVQEVSGDLQERQYHEFKDHPLNAQYHDQRIKQRIYKHTAGSDRRRVPLASYSR